MNCFLILLMYYPVICHVHSKEYFVRNQFSRAKRHNVSVVDIRQWEEHALLKETEGDYNTGAYVYQEYVKPVAYSGRYPVIGSWIVGGEPAGIGIRENRTEITDNLSEFVPHIISCL